MVYYVVFFTYVKSRPELELRLLQVLQVLLIRSFLLCFFCVLN